MTKRKIVELLTMKALAKRLGMEYGTLRNKLMKIRQSDSKELDGYILFGVSHKQWYAYPKDSNIEIKVVEDYETSQ